LTHTVIFFVTKLRAAFGKSYAAVTDRVVVAVVICGRKLSRSSAPRRVWRRCLARAVNVTRVANTLRPSQHRPVCIAAVSHYQKPSIEQRRRLRRIITVFKGRNGLLMSHCDPMEWCLPDSPKPDSSKLGLGVRVLGLGLGLGLGFMVRG